MKSFKELTKEKEENTPPTFHQLINSVGIIRDSLMGLSEITNEYNQKVDELYKDVVERLEELERISL